MLVGRYAPPDATFPVSQMEMDLDRWWRWADWRAQMDLFQ